MWGQWLVRVPPAQAQIVDIVGAGDTFDAGLLQKDRLASLGPDAVAQALEFGARVAAVTVSRAGANPPWANELLAKTGSAMTSINEAELVQKIKERAAGQDRLIVAIAGPPGSGKSTIAQRLSERLAVSSAIVPMDGFHKDNEELHQLGLLHRKGAPETFDAAAFVELIRKLRSAEAITFPAFDRDEDRTVPDAGQVRKGTRVVLVEGNYLLLDSPPWRDLAGLFDLSILLDVPREVLKSRLIQRWLDHGLSSADAEARATENDLANVDHVLQNSSRPDVLLQASVDT